MTERQFLADGFLRRPNWKRRPVAILRHIARKVAFFSQLRGLIERRPRSPEEAQRHWDALMSQSHFASYLGRTINVDSSNAMTATLIKYHANSNPSVLDVGCGAGTLALSLSSFSRYLGTDVSRHAIHCGRADMADTPLVELDAIDLRLFETKQKWDVIVFNEVLYYLSTTEAVKQVSRYVNFLSRDGILCISMKHDPKSSVIFKLLQDRYPWVNGMIWQRKYEKADYSIRIDRECPGFLLAVFKPN
jgi:cyclopropane fatty-acyl-phospholipid synthase-like methyltransferase